MGPGEPAVLKAVTIAYSLTILWHERQRFLPAVLAVAFSAILVALQSGLLFGLFSIASIPIDNAAADLWVGSANTVSIDQGAPIPDRYLTRLACHPEVERCEIYLKGLASWSRPGEHDELCMVIGSRLDADSLGAVRQLSAQQRVSLAEPGAVIVDQTELGRLGLPGAGHSAEINNRHVRVVSCVTGLQSLAAPYVFCSIETARQLLHLRPEQVTYVLARCRQPAQAPVVAERLLAHPTLSAVSRDDFSRRTRLHWMVKTKAGIALAFSAVLGLLVGAVVTSQTLYAAVVSSLREYAVLRALGIPRWRIATCVLAESFWVGLAGLGLATPTVFGLAAGAGLLGAKVLLPPLLLGAAGFVTMAMALLSGVAALRSLRLLEPAALLR